MSRIWCPTEFMEWRKALLARNISRDCTLAQSFSSTMKYFLGNRCNLKIHNFTTTDPSTSSPIKILVELVASLRWRCQQVHLINLCVVWRFGPHINITSYIHIALVFVASYQFTVIVLLGECNVLRLGPFRF
jgi:hypothetical protein